MDSPEIFSEVRRGTESPYGLAGVAIPFVMFFVGIAMVDPRSEILIVCAAVLVALGIFLLYGVLGYRRKVSLDADGYIEQASIPGWVLWREEYELSEVHQFDIRSDYDKERRLIGRKIILCLANGERREGMLYRPKIQVRWIMNRMNNVLNELKQRPK